MRACVRCGKQYEARKATARYCSAQCRVAAARARAKAQPPTGTPAPLLRVVADGDAPDVAGVEDAVRWELSDIASSVVAQLAFALARRIDAISTADASIAPLSKQLQALMAAAAASRPEPEVEDDPVLRAQRAVAVIRERFASGSA